MTIRDADQNTIPEQFADVFAHRATRSRFIFACDAAAYQRITWPGVAPVYLESS
jgi:hypothetical protein